MQILGAFTGNMLSLPDSPFFYEDLAFKSGYSLVAGVDEAGRGSLAGPVVAAAAIIPPEHRTCAFWDKVKDSKQMSAIARQKAFAFIVDNGIPVSIGVVSRTYIDTHNILKASLEAMRRAIVSLSMQPDFILVDGMQAVPISIPQKCIKKGDQISKSISAASVLAKVYRDRIMDAYHEIYPYYHFNRNKGYGTRQHIEALKTHGPAPIHRLTFKGVVQV